MPTIRLQNAAKLYKGNGRKSAAVLDIDLQVEQGEFIFFVGSRGAGKSTLLDLICGDLQPDRGAVWLDNINLGRVAPWQKRYVRSCFGKVSQDTMLSFTEPVIDFMSSGKQLGSLKNKLIDRPLAAKALGLVGMAGSEFKYPIELTAAECRKVELARAIMHSPPILILDEITDQLDNDSIWDIMHLLSELNRRGTTVLMSTRASQFVNIMRRRVITLVDGKIVGDIQHGRFGTIF